MDRGVNSLNRSFASNSVARAVAALNNVERIAELLSCNRRLALVGLQLRIINGVISLLTTEVPNKPSPICRAKQSGTSRSLDLTALEVLAVSCLSCKSD